MTESLNDKNAGSSRRNFLKTSGVAAIGATLIGERVARADAAPPITAKADPAEDLKSAADQVNILQGTDSTPDFSRGNTLPIAAMPFGMAHWTLQSHAGTPWMFAPGVRRIQGFRCTHQLSPWLDDYGHAIFMPFCGDADANAGARASSYRPEEAQLTPYSMKMKLLRYRGDVELVPTERCCVLTASFEKREFETSTGLIFDVLGKDAAIKPDAAHKRILFTSTANAGGVPEGFAAYYVIQFAESWVSFDSKHQEGRPGHEGSLAGIVKFKPGQAFEARIATSFISFDQALLNLEKELGNKTIETVREAAKKQWNEHLNRIEIEGATAKQRRTFYSCMYRALLFPRMFHEPDAQGQMQHYSAFTGKVSPGLMYADHGYWDVYRAWYPLMSIVFPERLGEILQAWVNAYKEGGWLPQFPAPGYRACMTGSLIDSVFGDAAAKGIKGFDLEGAFEGLKKHATMPGDAAKGFGRVGIEDYLEYNYLPADRIDQSVAETVDAAYGDFCIAQVAKAAGKQADYEMLMKRSENWKNVFDAKVKFFRGKKADGSWLAPFDPLTWGNPYVEGGAWQHRWDAPHAIPELIELMGGKEASAAALEQMVTMEPAFNVGVYGAEIHEMSEMAAVPFGQYAHSNQPSHAMLYLFVAAGRPDRTQYWVRKVMDELYSPEHFAGDEDTGSMAAWYILSALGFYPGCPGKADYTLGSPLFSKATVHLENGKMLVVEAPSNKAETVYVRSVSIDGKSIAGQKLEHASITSGGTLHFEMTASSKG